MSRSPGRMDDGFRHLPKRLCPYCHVRAIDVNGTELYHSCELIKVSDEGDKDFIMECPNCHRKVALQIKYLHAPYVILPVQDHVGTDPVNGG